MDTRTGHQELPCGLFWLPGFDQKVKEQLSLESAAQPQFLGDEPNPADNKTMSSVSLAVPLGAHFMFSLTLTAPPAMNAWYLETKWKGPLVLHSKQP